VYDGLQVAGRSFSGGCGDALLEVGRSAGSLVVVDEAGQSSWIVGGKDKSDRRV